MNDNRKSLRLIYEIIFFRLKKYVTKALLLISAPFDTSLKKVLIAELEKLEALLRLHKRMYKQCPIYPKVGKLLSLFSLSGIPPGKMGKLIWSLSWMVSPKVREDAIGDIIFLAREKRRVGESVFSVCAFICKALVILLMGRIRNVFRGGGGAGFETP